MSKHMRLPIVVVIAAIFCAGVVGYAITTNREDVVEVSSENEELCEALDSTGDALTAFLREGGENFARVLPPDEVKEQLQALRPYVQRFEDQRNDLHCVE